MAKFISISGPSTTGKTSIIKRLQDSPDTKNLIFGHDIHEKVWSDLVDMQIFSEFTEISTDSSFLCTYIMRVTDYYNSYLDSYRESDKTVVLDGCWLDLSIYSILNSWYTRIIKPVQEEMLHRITKYDEDIVKMYITKADDESYPVEKFRRRGKMTTFRENRPLEIRYYDIARHLDVATRIPTSDTGEASEFILKDLRDSGYLV